VEFGTDSLSAGVIQNAPQLVGGQPDAAGGAPVTAGGSGGGRGGRSDRRGQADERAILRISDGDQPQSDQLHGARHRRVRPTAAQRHTFRGLSVHTARHRQTAVATAATRRRLRPTTHAVSSIIARTFLKLIHAATPDTTKLSCLCRVRFGGGVNWIRDNSRLSPTEN